MTATIIDGKAIAAQVRAEVGTDVAAFTAAYGHPLGLATILVGEYPASAVYVGGKQRTSAELGMATAAATLPATASSDEVATVIERLNADPLVHGILLQLPLPGHLSETELTGLIDPAKDVDGLTPLSAGLLALGRPGLRPCTPAGVMRLLAAVDAELEGAEAVVGGRSNLFGKPMAQLLLAANATVTV